MGSTSHRNGRCNASRDTQTGKTYLRNGQRYSARDAEMGRTAIRNGRRLCKSRHANRKDGPPKRTTLYPRDAEMGRTSIRNGRRYASRDTEIGTTSLRNRRRSVPVIAWWANADCHCKVVVCVPAHECVIISDRQSSKLATHTYSFPHEKLITGYSGMIERDI